MRNLTNKPHYFLSVILLATLLSVFGSIGLAQEFEDEEFVQDKETSQQKTQNDAIKLFNQGQDAHSKGDLKTALAFYEKALEVKPAFVEAEYQRATILTTFGKLEEAEKSFRKSLELKPGWALAKTGLGIVLTRAGKYAEGEDLLFETIKTDPSNLIALNSLTESLVRSNAFEAKLKSVLESLSRITEKDNTPASIWISKGILEKALEDRVAAKASFERALSLDGKNQAALFETIDLYIKDRDSKNAVDRSKFFVASYPDSMLAKMLLARSYELNGDSAEALKVLESIQKPSPEVVSFIKEIKFGGNENVDDLEKLLVDDPNNASVLGKLCSLMRTTDSQKALDYCRKALELDKSNINYAIGYGAALVQLKQYPTAVAVFRNLLKYDAKNYTVRANLATALFQLNEFEEAKTEYQWIVAEKPNLAVGFYFLAICYDKLEEYEDALEKYEHFLRLAKAENMTLEIEKVSLRLPGLKSQIKSGKGKKRKGEK